jgi:hypothetical protein
MGNTSSSRSPATIVAAANKASTPAVVRPAGGVSALAAPLDTVTACRVKNVELSQLQNDVSKKQTEIDTCDPVEANRRRTNTKLKEYTDYVTEKEKTLNELDSSIKNTLSTLNSVYSTTNPTRSYIDKLIKESESLDKSKKEYEQAERTQRRAFLDNGPQDGVSGILGVRTDDDKILLAFWIVYGIAMLALTFALLSVYGGELTMSQKIQIGFVALAASYGLAYYGISVYG